MNYYKRAPLVQRAKASATRQHQQNAQHTEHDRGTPGILQLQQSVGNQAVMQLMKDRLAQMKIHEYRKADNALGTYLTALDTLVNKQAQVALSINNIVQGTSGYLDHWQALAQEYLDDNSSIPPFLYTAYGYAVETLTNLNLSSINSSLPNGWSVQTQATRGMTRPDIVVFDDNSNEVAWFDITSENSVGHIKNKASGGWSSKDYVYEISYPALDLSGISFSGSMFEGIKVRNNLKALKKKRGLAINKLQEDLIDMKLNEDTSTKVNTRALFNQKYGYVFPHNTIKSLIEMAKLAFDDFGYDKNEHGRDIAGARELLEGYYVSSIALYKE